ncbi:MAG: hypothetical protein WBG90_18500 [Saonia sp.]
MADTPITRRLKIFINGQEVDATITNLRKNLSKFRALANRQIEGTDKFKEYNAEVAKLETELKEATDAQKKFRKDTKLTEAGISKSEEALSNFTGSFSTLIRGFKSGDILQIKEGFNGVRTGIRGATKAALAFIATPIGATIALLVGVGAAAKKWFDYNQQVVTAIRLTTQLTGLTDAAADQARIRTEALVKTFGVDFQETQLTANSLVQQFGITFTEAFDLLENQLVRGQKKNDEFFQSLNEYPTFFKQAGFSAEEFGRIISTGFDLGIYSDKFPDAIKEFDLAIKEQTDTTRDALINAFGAPFTERILKQVRTGQLTSKEALEEISLEAEKSNINIQQNAQLTADLFKGAGEDAGGALKIFEAYNTAIVQNQRELTESEKIIQDQVRANKELKQITSAIFATGDKGFGLLIDKAKLFGTKILIDILTAGVDVYNWFVDLNNESRTFSALLSGIGIAATLQFEIIGILIRNTKTAFSGFGDVIEGVFTLDPEKIREGLSKGILTTKNAFDEIKEKARADAAEIKKALEGGFKLERKSLGDFNEESSATDQENRSITEDNQTGGSGKLSKEDQKILDSRKKLLEFLRQLEEEEDIRKQLKKLEEDQRAEEEEILRLENKFAKLAEEAGLTNELEAQLSEEELALKAQLEEAKETEIQAIRDKFTLIREKKNQESLDKIAKQDAKYKNAQIKAESELQAAKRELLDVGISALQGFFDESSSIYRALFLGEKAVAAARVVVDGIAERAKISAAWGAFPPVLTPLLAASKIRTATGLITIASTAIKGFRDGGETFDGPSAGGVDGRGGRLAVLHPEEYVVPRFVRKDPEVPAIIQYLEGKRRQALPSLNNGGELTDTGEASLGTDSYTMEVLTVAVNRLNDHLDRGLRIEYTLNSEIERRELAEKLDDTIKESQGN